MMDGEAVSQGIDPLKLPFHRFLNWVYWMFARGRDEKERAKLDFDLARPPEGTDPDEVDEGEWSDEATGDTFLALAGRMGQPLEGVD